MTYLNSLNYYRLKWVSKNRKVSKLVKRTVYLCSLNAFNFFLIAYSYYIYFSISSLKINDILTELPCIPIFAKVSAVSFARNKDLMLRPPLIQVHVSFNKTLAFTKNHVNMSAAFREIKSKLFPKSKHFRTHVYINSLFYF